MLRPLFALLFVSLLFTACSTNNVTVDNSLQRYFDSAGVKGSFGFFDNGQGRFTIFNLPRFRDSTSLPAATFDIVLSLIGIQTGIVKDDSSLRYAFRSADDSARATFTQLAARIGKDTLKKWIDSLHYGNRIINTYPAAFWQNNQLKITSDEQLGLMKKLYFNQLPFFKRPQELVRALMPAEKNTNYQLVYKTGEGLNEDGKTISWTMGWVEENKHPYFFVVNLEAAGSGTAAPTGLDTAGLKIARNILQQMGFFQGKK